MSDSSPINHLARAIWGEHPLQSEYGPLDAFLIGAGYSTNALLGNAAKAYYSARRNLADTSGDALARAAWQASIDAKQRDLAEHERLYAPMTRAYPYVTAFGEAVPAIAAATPSGGFSLAPAGVSFADRYAQEAARAGGYEPQGVLGPLRQALTGTSPAEALRLLLNK